MTVLSKTSCQQCCEYAPLFCFEDRHRIFDQPVVIPQFLKRLGIRVENLVEIRQLFPLLRRKIFVDLLGELSPI